MGQLQPETQPHRQGQEQRIGSSQLQPTLQRLQAQQLGRKGPYRLPTDRHADVDFKMIAPAINERNWEKVKRW